jgi:hypothetical protein
MQVLSASAPVTTMAPVRAKDSGALDPRNAAGAGRGGNIEQSPRAASRTTQSLLDR